jgi:hypothetical protein
MFFGFTHKKVFQNFGLSTKSVFSAVKDDESEGEDMKISKAIVKQLYGADFVVDAFELGVGQEVLGGAVG